jgi:predicted transcriptional regulator
MVDYKYAQVKDVMTKPVLYIDATDTVQEALNKMKSAGVKKAIILDQGEVYGHTDSWKLKLVDMGKKVKDAIHDKENIYSKVSKVSQDRLLNEIVDALRKEGIKVVTNEKGDNIGVITPLDLLKVKSLGLRL